MKRLLIVDNEGDQLFMTALAAESIGFMVQTARDGKEGLAKARRFRPDVALVDGAMPRMDGFELCRRLRRDSRTRRTPVVILSAGEPARYRALAMLAGADKFVRKPYDQDELMSLLLTLPRRKKGRSNGGASGIRTRE